MKELCPEYSRIADRCTAPLDKRPKDTSALLKMLDRVDRRPKLVAQGLAAAMLIALVAAVSLHIRSISAETAEAWAQIDTLTNSNARNAEKVAELENLIYIADARLETAVAAVSGPSANRGRRRRALIDGYRRLENEYAFFDRHRMPLFASAGEEYGDSIDSFRERCNLIAIESYDLKRFPELSYADSAVLIGEIRNLSDQLYSIYFSVWSLKLEKKRMEAEAQ